MARPLRIAFEGAFYHVTARGNERRKGTSYIAPVKGEKEKLLKNFIFCKNSQLRNHSDF
jgi:hypothetical protein